MLGLFNKEKKNSPVNQQDPIPRAERLLKEYDHIFKCFRNHPYISVKEVFGTPPEKYHFLYRVDGLVHTGKSLESKNDHLVEIALPAGYPAKDPICKALTPIYHPNISSESIDIKQLLTPGTFLADLVVKVGEMIVYQRYSIDDPLNLQASQWAARNKSILPLSSVNLNYTLPEEAPDTVSLDDQPTEAADQTPAGNTQKTETILIESDSDKIKFDQERPAEPRQSPKDRQVVEMLLPENAKRKKSISEEIVAIEEDTVAIQASPATFVQNPNEKASTPDNQSSDDQTEGMDFELEPLPGPEKKTELFVSKHDIYCPSCGNMNNRNANFCIHCGKRIVEKSVFKNARTFFVAAMIAVPFIIIGSGIGAIFLRTIDIRFLKTSIFQTSQSVPSAVKSEQESPLPLPKKELVYKTTTGKEALQEPESVPSKAEKALLPEKPLVSVNKNASVSEHKTMMEKPSEKPVQSKKHIVESATEQPVRAKKTVEKTNDEIVSHRQPTPHAGNEHQNPEKIANALKLAKLYVGIGSYDDAIAQYLDVLMLDPANQEAREGLVKARETKKTTLGK